MSEDPQKLRDLLSNRQMPDHAVMKVTLGELRAAFLVPPPAAPGLREALDLAIDAFDPMASDWPDFAKSIAGLEALKSARAALAAAPGLDVERLAAAIRANWYEIRPSGGPFVRPVEAAQSIAREYAALAKTPGEPA